MVKPDWAIAASYGPWRAQPPRRREPWGARRPVPIGGRWRFAVVGRDRPATNAWAWVAGSWRCGSDRRLRVRALAQAGRRRRGRGARRPFDGRRASALRPVDVQVRRATRVGANVIGAEWRLLRLGFDYPDDTATARGAALSGWSSSFPAGADLFGVLTTLATRRQPGCGSALCRHGAIPCLRAHAQVAA